MIKPLLSLFVAAPVLITPAFASTHIHTETCLDAVKASPFTVTINELKQKYSTTELSADGKTVIDLMAFYQPSYAAKRGEQWAHSRIQELVNNTNIALANSGINAIVNLVNAQPITGISDDLHYNTSPDGLIYGAGTIASARIQNPYENFPENSVYEEMGADLALYIRDYNEDLQPDNVFGYGTLGGELSTVFDTATLEESNSLYKLADFVLAHEIGHNFEGGHLNDDGGYTFLPAAHAHTCAGKTTIMGPASINGHQFYSDPSKLVNGEACGIQGVADNTSVLKEHIPLAASRRIKPESIGTVSLEAAYTIDSGDSVATISVKRTGDLTQAASVQVALYNDTAKEGVDFFNSFERVSFEPGLDIATFTVPLSQTPTGKATVKLRYPHKLDIAQPESVLILSDEPAEIGVFGFTDANQSVTEDAGTLTLKIVRSNGANTEHAVRVFTEDRERKAGTDYTAIDTTLIFAEGETEKLLTIQIKDNSIPDSNGTFLVKLDGQGAELSVADVVVTIINNDAQPSQPGNSGGSGGSFNWMLLTGLMLLLRFRKRKY